ncbi:hypothetical protein BDW72DRAFT_189794 [Aspergillus terricola var. indicus]
MAARSRSRSRSRQRQDLSKFQASPSSKRMTRSQSREIEELHVNSNRLIGHDRRSKRVQSKALDPVVEESPPEDPTRMGDRHAKAVTPDPDVADITGTTFVQESETDFEAGILLDTLRDIEQNGNDVLELLIPSRSRLVDAVKKANQLSDPKNTQSKRLLRLLKILDEDIKIFGSHTYIDVDGVARKVSSALADRREDLEDWNPAPIMQMANCARFACEILLAGTNPNSQRQAIRNIQKLFPRPFMTGLAGAGEEKEAGESALGKETLNLALEIRTQSLILQLEDNQDSPDFNAKNAVRLCFFTDSSRKSPLRGFNLPSFSNANGTLPAQYIDDVQNRYEEILLGEMDGMFDVNDLRSSYNWQRFVLHASHWIRKRTDEIHAEVKKRISTQAVRHTLSNVKVSSFGSTLGPSEAEPSGELQEAGGDTTRQDAVAEELSVVPEPQPQPQQLESRDVHRDAKRRRSSRPSYLNSASIQRIAQRQERLRTGTETSERRQQPDIVQPEPPTGNEPPTVDRHDPSALPSNRPSQQALFQERVPSFDDDPTLVTEEPELNFDDDSELANADESTQIERSRSPSVAPRRTAPWRSEPTSTAQTTDSLRLTQSQMVWEAVKDGISTRPASSPRRSVTSRFIDRQPDAARVSPIRDDDSQRSAVRRVESRVSRKRARASTETDSDVDESIFDSDDRSLDIESQRAKKPQRQRSKRPRLGERESQRMDASANTHQSDIAEEPPRPVRRRTVQPAPISSQRSVGQYTSRPRSSWTEAEDNRLIRLMKDHGHKWSLIERHNIAQPAEEGEVRIEGRGQVAFKDRARNMKISYYREGLRIPDYLEHVTMKEKDVEKLLERGITNILPHDMEAYNRARAR